MGKRNLTPFFNANKKKNTVNRENEQENDAKRMKTLVISPTKTYILLKFNVNLLRVTDLMKMFMKVKKKRLKSFFL